MIASTDTFLGYWNPDRIPGYSEKGMADVTSGGTRRVEPGGGGVTQFSEGDRFAAYEQRDGCTLLGDGIGYAWIDSAKAQMG